jgi:hypothetical protein
VTATAAASSPRPPASSRSGRCPRCSPVPAVVRRQASFRSLPERPPRPPPPRVNAHLGQITRWPARLPRPPRSRLGQLALRSEWAGSQREFARGPPQIRSATDRPASSQGSSAPARPPPLEAAPDRPPLIRSAPLRPPQLDSSIGPGSRDHRPLPALGPALAAPPRPPRPPRSAFHCWE